MPDDDLIDRAAGPPEPDKEHQWWAWWRVDGQGALTQLLRGEWNPLGVEDIPEDEYASYATRLGGLLREGISEDEAASYLEEARTGAMGLPAHPDEDRRVAAIIHAWYLEVRRAAK